MACSFAWGEDSATVNNNSPTGNQDVVKFN
jgi:hypothetical protein